MHCMSQALKAFSWTNLTYERGKKVSECMYLLKILEQCYLKTKIFQKLYLKNPRVLENCIKYILLIVFV